MGRSTFAAWVEMLLVVNQLALAVTTLAVVVGAASLVVRFRRARGVERQQLRWVASAAALAVAGGGGRPGRRGGGGHGRGHLDIGGCLAILPLAIGAAILRYRLYDLDRIISRTLAYGLLTCCWVVATPWWSWASASCWAGLQPGRGRGDPGGGGAVPAGPPPHPAGGRPALQPRRHDTAQTIAAFSDRLHQQIDLDTLTAELLAVVDQTMQPTQASLWLRPPPPSSSDTAPSEARPTTWAY